jgi:hypothetical protein
MAWARDAGIRTIGMREVRDLLRSTGKIVQ